MVWCEEWGAVVGSFGKLQKKQFMHAWHHSIKGPIHFKRMFHNFPCELQLVIRTVLLTAMYCTHACTYNVQETGATECSDEISQFTTMPYRSPDMVSVYSGKTITTKSDIWVRTLLCTHNIIAIMYMSTTLFTSLKNKRYNRIATLNYSVSAWTSTGLIYVS